MKSHRPCYAENKDYSVWKKISHPFPYNLFFDFYEMKNGSNTYYERVNKLDRLFDWICRRI